MESYIKISNINDFLYCPVSIYLHSIYENFNTKAYHQTPQVVGSLHHKSIDEGAYSTAKRYEMAKEVWSEEFGLAGKIDVYDNQTKTLIERKTRVKTIYQGYRYQLYAQYFCMKEMGYEVNKLLIHSLEDNKRYSIPIPNDDEINEFAALLKEMRSFDMSKIKNHKCKRCSESIYSPMLWEDQ